MGSVHPCPGCGAQVTYFVHFTASPVGPMLTVGFKSKRKALKAIREAKRVGEGARLQAVKS